MRHALPIGWTLAAAALALNAFSCVQDNRFDPSGCDVHLEGTWTVEGQDPRILVDGECAQTENGEIDQTRNEICRPDSSANNLGIAEVRLFLFDPENNEPWEDRGDLLLFNCNPCFGPRSPDENVDGNPPSFLDSNSEEEGVRRTDRCGGTGELLRAGTYNYRWIAFSGIGQVIDCTPIETLEFVTESDPPVIQVPPVDFSQGPGLNACP